LLFDISMKALARGIHLRKPGAKIVRNGEISVKVFNKLATECDCIIRSTELLNPFLNKRAEMPHETLNRPSSSITESTDSATFNLFSD
jgi:hypothetical protein